MPPITDPAALAQIQRQQQQQGVTLAGPAAMAGAPPMPPPMPFSGARPMSLPPMRQQSQALGEAHLRLSESNAARAASNEAARIELARRADKRAQDDFNSKNITVAPPGDVTKRGEDYFKTIPPHLADQAKTLIDGRRAWPKGAALRNPQMQELIAIATQADPTIDDTENAKRAALRKNYTGSGIPGRNVIAINTALHHMWNLWNTAQKLDNRGSPIWNAPANYAEQKAFGKPALSQFEIDRQAVADEFEKVFTGAGGGSLAGRIDWQKRFSSASSPEQFRGIMEEAVNLLDGRLQELDTDYSNGMNIPQNPERFLSPQALKVFKALGPGGSGLLDESVSDPNQDKAVSTTQKTVPVPEGYQQGLTSFLQHHPKGTLTPEGYRQIRQQLDEKYNQELNGAVSTMTDEEVNHFVDAYNKGATVTKIPGINTPLSENKNAVGLSEKDRAEIAAAGPGVMATNFANAASFGTVGLAAGNDKLAAMNKDHAPAALTGEVLGSILGMGGLERLGAKALTKFGGRKAEDATARVIARDTAAAAKRRFMGDATVNAVYGGGRGATGDPDHPVEGAVKGAGAGVLATGTGNLVTKGVTPFLSDSTQAALKQMKGVKATTLQKLGLGRLEEAGTGIPFTHGARQASVKSFNIDNANRALANIGQKVPKGVAPGTELNSFVHDRLSSEYNTIRPKIVGAADGAYDTSIAAIAAKSATSDEKKAMFSEVNDALKMFTDENGHYTGQGYKEASERLRYLSKTWSAQAESQGSVAAGDMARAAEQARKQMQTLIQRQTPEVGQHLKKIERGWAHLVRIEDASNRALASGEAVYSPGQYITSIKKLDNSGRKSTSAQGKALDLPYGEAAAKILGSGPVPKLSLKETAIVTSALTGSGFVSPGIPITAASIGAALYVPGVKQVIQKILSGQRPSVVDNELIRRALEDASRHQMTGGN